MADHVQPGRTGDEQEVSSSGLVLSVDPLPGTTGYKLSADDSKDKGDKSVRGDAGADTNDQIDFGGDTDGTDTSDTDTSDTDTDTSDTLGGDTDSTDESDADGTDLGDAEEETESGLGGVNPLGVNRPERVRNGDDKDTRDT